MPGRPRSVGSLLLTVCSPVPHWQCQLFQWRRWNTSEEDTEKEQRELSVSIMKLIFPRPASRPVTRSAFSELC